MHPGETWEERLSLRLKILTIMVGPVTVLFAATIALLVLRLETTRALSAERHEAALGDGVLRACVEVALRPMGGRPGTP